VVEKSGTVEFTCYVAGVNSSAKPISIDREGNGKLVLEFSASDKDAVLRLLNPPYNESALVVSVTIDAP